MAKAPKPNGCRNCRWIDKTGGGRSGPWECTYPVVLPPLPDAITSSGAHEALLRTRTQGMWVEDGTTCPTWAEPPPPPQTGEL